MGETSNEDRLAQFADKCPDIVVTNPDFLHYQLYRGKGKDWKNWQQFLTNLKLVVLDEAHTYTGVVGI